MPKTPKTKTGFSLIELLIYLALAAIVITVITTFAVWLIRLGAQTKNNYAVTSNARRAMEIMTYEIKKAQSIYTPTSVLGATPGQLSLQQTATTTPGETQTFIDFFRCGEALCLKRDGLDPQAITNDQVRITSLLFTKLTNSATSTSVQINLQLESLAKGLSPAISSIDLTTTARLSSY